MDLSLIHISSTIVGLAALLASAATPLVLWWRNDLPEAKLFLLLSALLWIMHHANIARLVGGAETKIGDN